MAKARNFLLRSIFYCSSGKVQPIERKQFFGATGIIYTVETVLCTVQKKTQKSLTCAGKIDNIADGRLSSIYSWLTCVTYSSAWGPRGGGVSPQYCAKLGPRGKKIPVGKTVFSKISWIVYCEYYPYCGVGYEILSMLPFRCAFVRALSYTRVQVTCTWLDSLNKKWAVEGKLLF